MSAARGRSRTSGTTRFILLAAVVGVVLAFAVMVFRNLNAEVSAAPDFSGEGTGNALLHVEPGDTLGMVGDRLYDLGTVASTRAFTGAASGTPVEGIQPGYYQVREEMSAASVVAALADPRNRVGFIDIKPGGRLLDTVVVGGGKASGAMVAALDALWPKDAPLEGLVLTRYHHTPPDRMTTGLRQGCPCRATARAIAACTWPTTRDSPSISSDSSTASTPALRASAAAASRLAQGVASMRTSWPAKQASPGLGVSNAPLSRPARAAAGSSMP